MGKNKLMRWTRNLCSFYDAVYFIFYDVDCFKYFFKYLCKHDLFQVFRQGFDAQVEAERW